VSQQVRIRHTKVKGEVYLGVREHPRNGMPGDAWSHDPNVVNNWLADGYRTRFNQHRSKRSKYLTIDGELFTDATGERVLVPLGDSIDDCRDTEARSLFPHLAALPMQVIQAAEKMENTEWWAAIKRRKTNITKGRKAGAMPGFVSRHHTDQSFPCWYNGGKNAVFSKVSAKAGIVTITGQNPTGKYGSDDVGLRWSVEYHVKLSQEIRPYTSVRVNWTTGRLVFVNEPLPVTKLATERGMVGMDRGITHSIATSDGEFIDAPDTTELDQKVRRTQKAMARSKNVAKKQSRNFWESNHYQDRKAELGELCAHKARIMDNWRHQAATDLIRRYNTLILEDLEIAGMTRRGKGKGRKAKTARNRGMRNAGLADLRSKLKYRSDLLDSTNVAGVNPAWTSQRCNHCGHICKENRESQAVFRCVKCGHCDNADINAAKNILDRHLGKWGWTGPKTGSDVRPTPSRVLATAGRQP
jgi:transposase